MQVWGDHEEVHPEMNILSFIRPHVVPTFFFHGNTTRNLKIIIKEVHMACALYVFLSQTISLCEEQIKICHYLLRKN